jgi:hypothetical protein
MRKWLTDSLAFGKVKAILANDFCLEIWPSAISLYKSFTAETQ